MNIRNIYMPTIIVYMLFWCKELGEMFVEVRIKKERVAR